MKGVGKCVLVCGTKGVGKTAVIEQLVYGNVTRESVSKLPRQRQNRIISLFNQMFHWFMRMFHSLDQMFHRFIYLWGYFLSGIASDDRGHLCSQCGRRTNSQGLDSNIWHRGTARKRTGTSVRRFKVSVLYLNVIHLTAFQLPKHYFLNPDAFVLVYDPSDPISLDMLGGIKNDIEKNKEKKDVIIVVVANMRARSNRPTGGSGDAGGPPSPLLDPVETILNRANNWCGRERIKHYVVNAMERASVYPPFVDLAVRLHPQQTKTTFPQLRQLTQKSQKSGDWLGGNN